MRAATGLAILPVGTTVDVPTGYAQFPAAISKPPRSATENVSTDLRRWSVMPRGGHFAAIEQPVAYAKEIRLFLKELRNRSLDDDVKPRQGWG